MVVECLLWRICQDKDRQTGKVKTLFPSTSSSRRKKVVGFYQQNKPTDMCHDSVSSQTKYLVYHIPKTSANMVHVAEQPLGQSSATWLVL